MNVLPWPTLAVDAEVAAEQAGDLAADREAEAGAAVLAARRAVRLLERLEDQALLVLRDADAGIGDRERDDVGAPSAVIAQLDAAALGELDRVRQQVAQHLTQPHVVGVDRRAAGSSSSSTRELQALLLGDLAERLVDVVAQVARTAT